MAKKQPQLKDMALHSALIGLAIFGYMSVFGHGLPTELRGPLVK